VATWNIFGGRTWDGARVDLDLILETLRRVDADLVALQEVDRDLPRSGGADQARLLGEALGMAWRFAPALLGTPGAPDAWRPAEPGLPDLGGPAYGIAMLSRLPIGDVKTVRLPQRGREEPRVAQVAEVTGGGTRLTVTGTHLSLVPGANVSQLRALQRYLDGVGGPRLLLGDLNLWLPLVRIVSLPGWRSLIGGWGFGARTPGIVRPRVRLDHTLAAGTDGVLRYRHSRVVAGAASDHSAVQVDLDWLG
jgi:endonuclease/exonuclease/phosphatase family metal-dependent hydrolase